MARSSAIVGGVVAVALIGGGAGAVLHFRRPPATVAVVVDPTLTTTRVRKMDLSDSRLVPGTLGYGSARTVKGVGPGVVTRLPAVGVLVKRGKALFRVDDKPVIVFYGDTPFFRPIDKPGIAGSDVRQLRRNLNALGYRVSSGDISDKSLLDAVKRWQKDLGLVAPGTLTPGQVVVLGGPGRVSALSATTGDLADGPLFEVTGTSTVVSVPMSPTDVPREKAVRIVLPDGKEVGGKVITISRTVVVADEQPKVTVTVRPDKKPPFDAAQVQVRFTTAARKGVLAVPVGALVALREGGYALQRPDGSLIAATTGIFAGGMVQVGGAGVEDGTTVVTTP